MVSDVRAAGKTAHRTARFKPSDETAVTAADQGKVVDGMELATGTATAAVENNRRKAVPKIRGKTGSAQAFYHRADMEISRKGLAERLMDHATVHTFAPGRRPETRRGGICRKR